jgi:hypothetical protein
VAVAPAEDEDAGADDWSPEASSPLPFPQAVSARASADVAASAVAAWSRRIAVLLRWIRGADVRRVDHHSMSEFSTDP